MSHVIVVVAVMLGLHAHSVFLGPAKIGWGISCSALVYTAVLVVIAVYRLVSCRFFRTLGPEASLVRTCCLWLDVFVADHRRRIQPPSGSLVEDGLLDPSGRPRMGGRRVAALEHGLCGGLLFGKGVRRGRREGEREFGDEDARTWSRSRSRSRSNRGVSPELFV
jgi:hypothetical protein